MKLTKYEHACFTVELEGKVLIVDPGVFTKTLEIPANVVGIVVTHEHEDHFDPEILAAIYDKNPESVLVSLASITEKMIDHKSIVVRPGDNITVGPFTLEFFGGKHAEIHSSIPLVDNVGVLVNQSIYYPGDSFAEPNRDVQVLALPASGPWYKMSETIDFMLAVKPQSAFPTHNIHNSEPGQALFDRIVGGFASRAHIEYQPLQPGQSIEL